MIIEWRQHAYDDRAAIMAYIANNNPIAAIELDEEIEAKVNGLLVNSKLYKPGRKKKTREMVIRPHYVVVYAETSKKIVILRVLHTAQQWP